MATDNRYRQEIQILEEYSNCRGTIERYEFLFHRVQDSVQQI